MYREGTRGHNRGRVSTTACYVLVKLASVRLSTNCITMLAVASWYWDYVLDIEYNISRAASSKSPSGQRIARASFYVFCEGRTELYLLIAQPIN